MNVSPNDYPDDTRCPACGSVNWSGNIVAIRPDNGLYDDVDGFIVCNECGARTEIVVTASDLN